MSRTPSRGRYAATRLTLTVLAAALGGTACGSDAADGGPLDPPPYEPPPPPPPPAPAPVGYTVYATDYAGNLLVFGSESPSVISRKKKITGLPILKRIIGIDFHPTNRKLYGIGTDSRVYVIDTLTAVAAAVSQTPFSPKIIDWHELHFGMAISPKTGRIRLIAAESGANWSIDAVTGVATAGKKPVYADGPHKGKDPMIIGVAYRPPASSAVNALMLSASAGRIASVGPCEDLMYAISPKYAEIIGSCDADEGNFTSLGPMEGVTAVGCGELKFDNGPGNLWLSLMNAAQEANSWGTVDPNTGWVTWHGFGPKQSAIQSVAFEPGGLYGPANATPLEVSPAYPGSSAARAMAPHDGGLMPCPGT